MQHCASEHKITQALAFYISLRTICVSVNQCEYVPVFLYPTYAQGFKAFVSIEMCKFRYTCNEIIPRVIKTSFYSFSLLTPTKNVCFVAPSSLKTMPEQQSEKKPPTNCIVDMQAFISATA